VMTGCVLMSGEKEIEPGFRKEVHLGRDENKGLRESRE